MVPAKKGCSAIRSGYAMQRLGKPDMGAIAERQSDQFRLSSFLEAHAGQRSHGAHSCTALRSH